MIYNKPRDINLRVFPSLSSLVPQRRKKNTSAFEEALSDSKSQKNVIKTTKEDATKTAPSALPLENPDIILTEKPGNPPASIVDVEEDTVFDVSEMQVIDGIPMLQLNDDTDNSTIKQSPFEEVPVTASGELLYDVEIDISEMPDIIGIPLLSLPDEPEGDSESAPVVISTNLEELTDEVKAKQRYVFERQMQIAEKYGLPVIIHDREAHGDCFEMVLKYPNINGIFHSYSGSAEMARELTRRGWYISFSGVVTFKNASRVREVLATIPLEKLLIETDAPYLAPHPNRGKMNHSGNLEYTVNTIASVFQKMPEEIAEITFENAKTIYNL